MKNPLFPLAVPSAPSRAPGSFRAFVLSLCSLRNADFMELFRNRTTRVTLWLPQDVVVNDDLVWVEVL